MPDPLTTFSLAALTLLAAAASALAWGRLWWPSARWMPKSSLPQRVILALTGLGALALFAYRALFVHQGWEPLQAHVDGLLLISAMVAAVVLFLQAPSRVPGAAPFALPVLTVLLAWAICASSFTLELFKMDSIWITVHLASVYVGTVFLAVAAVAGGMYLYAQRNLRAKRPTNDAAPMASLEAIETLIVRTSAIGFAVLTLGLITGLIIIASQEKSTLGSGWWYSPKVLLATVVWLIYAVIMNVRHTTTFRGRRAAWLSIAGLVLLLMTFALVRMGPSISSHASHTVQTSMELH